MGREKKILCKEKKQQQINWNYLLNLYIYIIKRRKIYCFDLTKININEKEEEAMKK